jgi:hypothetical protein
MEDTNKYDNLCPTVVTWTPKETESAFKVTFICVVILHCRPIRYLNLFGLRRLK